MTCPGKPHARPDTSKETGLIALHGRCSFLACGARTSGRRFNVPRSRRRLNAANRTSAGCRVPANATHGDGAASAVDFATTIATFGPTSNSEDRTIRTLRPMSFDIGHRSEQATGGVYRASPQFRWPVRTDPARWPGPSMNAIPGPVRACSKCSRPRMSPAPGVGRRLSTIGPRVWAEAPAGQRNRKE